MSNGTSDPGPGEVLELDCHECHHEWHQETCICGCISRIPVSRKHGNALRRRRVEAGPVGTFRSQRS